MMSVPSQKLSRVWFMAGLAAVSFLIAILISFQVVALATSSEGSLKVVDERLLHFIAQFRSPALTNWAVNITALGSPPVLMLLTVFMAIWLYLRQETFSALQLLVAAVGAWILTVTLKGIFNRTRPELLEHLVTEKSLSFPSGHALSASTIYFSLSLIAIDHLQSRPEKIFICVWSFILILTIALSRLYLAVHFPSDVTAGTAFGLAWALVVALLMRRMKLAR